MQRTSGRNGGLMVSELYSGSSGLGSSPGWGPALTLYPHSASLPTQVYKWVLANLLPGVTLGWTSIPSWGSRNTPSCFMLLKPG